MAVNPPIYTLKIARHPVTEQYLESLVNLYMGPMDNWISFINSLQAARCRQIPLSNLIFSHVILWPLLSLTHP